LAFPGRVSDETKRDLLQQNIELWDLDFISEYFKQQIAKTDDQPFKTLFTSARARTSVQASLIAELKSCPAGPKDWPVYQKLVGRIVEQLFCPPLNLPIPQHSNSSGINRPDYILPNYANEGFWYYIRTRYLADYIIVDPKNHASTIDKSEILKFANYLKAHGPGQFGILVCRVGADAGALITRREQWTEGDKLILILNDSDIEAMLLAQGAGGDPCQIISDRIQDFRLSI
jgi:hypothetical protein